jgi:hypothetical protein
LAANVSAARRRHAEDSLRWRARDPIVHSGSHRLLDPIVEATARTDRPTDRSMPPGAPRSQTRLGLRLLEDSTSMLDDALRDLKFDRRMLERRGWTTRAEVERTLADLPDVADKAAPPETGSPEPQDTTG